MLWIHTLHSVHNTFYRGRIVQSPGWCRSDHMAAARLSFMSFYVAGSDFSQRKSSYLDPTDADHVVIKVWVFKLVHRACKMRIHTHFSSPALLTTSRTCVNCVCRLTCEQPQIYTSGKHDMDKGNGCPGDWQQIINNIHFSGIIYFVCIH